MEHDQQKPNISSGVKTRRRNCKLTRIISGLVLLQTFVLMFVQNIQQSRSSRNSIELGKELASLQTRLGINIQDNLKVVNETRWGNHDSEPIHVLLIACNGGNKKDKKDQRRYVETGHLLKSIQINDSFLKEGPNVIVHVFTDDKVALSAHLEQEKYGLLSTFDYHIHELVSLENEDVNLFRPCASARLYAPALFEKNGIPVPETVIYLDSDTIVTASLQSLWLDTRKAFRENKELLYAMVPETYKPDDKCFYRKLNRTSVTIVDQKDDSNRTVFSYPEGTCGFNSGVMVAPLRRWVSKSFTNMVKEQINFAKKYDLFMPFGDQGILNGMAARHPEQLLELSCRWNLRRQTSKDCFDTYVLEQGGIVHGNNHALWPHYDILKAVFGID